VAGSFVLCLDVDCDSGLEVDGEMIFENSDLRDDCFVIALYVVLRKPVVPSRSSIMAYPSAWADNFGCNYYRHSQAREMAVIESNESWKISEEAQPFSGTGLHVTPPDKLFQGIHNIINEMKQEAKADDNGAGET